MPEPQAGKPDVGLRTLPPVGEPVQYNDFPGGGPPTHQGWEVPFLLSHYGFFFVFVCRISFSVVFLLMVVQHLVVILLFS